jgi:predicted N-acetyltransferase YhbS
MSQDAPLLRVAKERDIPELAALWTEAFAGSRSVHDRVRELRDGMPYGSLADCRIHERDGRIAAALRSYRLELHVRGRVYRTLGLSAVAVAADFRRRGVGRRVCVEALVEGRRRGDVLSLLYPFDVAFYRRLGYALAGELRHFRFRPGDLPRFPGWDRVARGDDADLGEVRALYGRVAARSSGMLERDRNSWKARLTSSVRLFVYRAPSEVLTGYAVVSASRRRHAPVLHVQEMVWEEDDAYRALLGWLSTQRDQYAFVTHDALPSEELHRHFAHPRAERARRARPLWFTTESVLRGPMIRLLNPGALQDEGADAVLSVFDPDLPENEGRWRGGKRVGTDAPAEPSARAEHDEGSGGADGALSMTEAARAFLVGALPGQAAPPEGWSPITAGDPFRLLDEF